MIDDVWDVFAEAVELLQSRRPMRRPRDRDLDDSESTIGCKLPTSYKCFAKRFGAGSLRLDDGPCEWYVWLRRNLGNHFNASLVHRNASCEVRSPAVWEGRTPARRIVQSSRPAPPGLARFLQPDQRPDLRWRLLTNDGLAHLAGLAPPEELDLSDDRRIAGPGLIHRKGLPKLRRPKHNSTCVSSATVRKALPNLRE